MSKKKQNEIEPQVPVVFFGNKVLKSDQFNEIWNDNYKNYIESLNTIYSMGKNFDNAIMHNTERKPISILANRSTNNIVDFITTLLYKSFEDIDEDWARHYIFELYNYVVTKIYFVDGLSKFVYDTIVQYSDSELWAMAYSVWRVYEQQGSIDKSSLFTSFKLVQIHNVLVASIKDVFITCVSNLIINMVTCSQLIDNSLAIYVTMFKYCFGTDYNPKKDIKPLSDQYEFSVSCLREVFFSTTNMTIFEQGIDRIIDNMILDYLEYVSMVATKSPDIKKPSITEES